MKQNNQQEAKSISKWLTAGLILISFIGLMDATYLTVTHYNGSELSCSVFSGCNQVTESKWSEFMGIPIALFGALYYFTILVMSLLYFDSKKSILIKLIFPLTVCGVLFSAFLVGLQLFVIKAICQYCMLSALTSTILFGLAGYMYIRKFVRRATEKEKILE